MMRKLINTSLRFRVLVTAVAVGLLFAGVTQLKEARVDLHPEFTPTFVEVQTEALGLSAHEVEQLITVPLEADLLNGVAWLDDIRSESVPGLSSIVMTFEPGTPLYRARQVVQERIAQAAVALPGVSKPPQMLQPVSSTSRTMMIGLSSKTLSLIDISQLARWTIKPRLMGVEGVANVSSFGHRERQLQVQVDPKNLNDKGVELLDVVEATGNALWVSPLSFLEASTPGTGGFIETSAQRLGIQHVSPIESAGDLAQVSLPPKSGDGAAGAALRLGDVAKVVEDHQPLIGDATLDNGAGIVLVVEKLPGANTVDVTKGVEEALNILRPGLKGLEIDTTLFRPADYVKDAKSNVGLAMMAALVLLIALLAFAFYQWRAALVSVATVVVSLVVAALVLKLRGHTFNSMVLAGLAIAVGAVVDDAISGTERILRRLREGGDKPVASSIVEATLEVRGSLVYALLFVLLPVVPVFFMGDIFGSFGRPLAISYGLALAASMATALMLTPALSLLLLSKTTSARESGLLTRLQSRYEGGLRRLLATPKPALVTVGVLALVGLVALPSLRRSTLPELKERDFLVELEAAPGTSLEKMKEITNDVSSQLRAVPGVRKVASHAGRAITSDKVVNVNQSDLWVSIEPDADYGKTVKALKKVVAAQNAGLDKDILTYTQARLKDVKSGADAPIVVRVFGNEQETLLAKAKEVGDAVGKIKGISDLQVELPVQEPTIEVEVDLQKAQRFGVKPGDVRRTAAYLLAGVEVGQLYYDQKIFEVVVWGTPEIRKDEAAVRNLLIDTPTGGQVRLEEVADVRRVTSPDVVEREGAFRRIDISASVAGRSRSAVASDVRDVISNMNFPLEFRAELLGTWSEKKAAETRLVWLGALAALGMVLLLQAAFGSWRLGVLFALALPVALVGGVLTALAGGGTVTIGSALGLLTVLGIAARNGIVLIRRYQQLERREGEAFGLDLVLKGARERLAPTLMTAVATGLVFLPVLLLGDRAGYEVLHPMAVVVLGGLVTATLVNVFVTPGIYLNFGSIKTETEVDLTLFEEELALNDRPPAGVPTGSTPVPLAGAGAGVES
ncbi:MAG: efflux RND transporter permease subunit [Actinomycetota bacterium]|jgi:CzcA family heavy metal efflux pump